MSGVFRPLLLAALVVLAGCGSFSSGGQPTETVTPAPVPTTEQRPTPTPRQVAPGLTTARIVDPFELTGAHVRQLENTSFTVTLTRTVRENGTVRSRSRIVGAFAGGYRRYVVRINQSGRGVTNASAVYQYDGHRVRQVIDGNVSADRFVSIQRGAGTAARDPVAPLPFDPDFGGRIFPLLVAASDDPIEVRHPPYAGPGRTLYVAQTSGENGAVLDRAVRDLEAVLLVDGEGIVRAYELRYTSIRNGSRVDVVERLSYTDVGQTYFTDTNASVP